MILTALQIKDSVLAPLLQLAIDALTCSADEHAELLLRDVYFRAEIRPPARKAAAPVALASGCSTDSSMRSLMPANPLA